MIKFKKKRINYIGFLWVILLVSCKKYNCECVATYCNPPKGCRTTARNQTVHAAFKSSANRTCKKYGDSITTCEIK